MRNKLIIIASALLLPFIAAAQESSINSFSPYTFYGLGDITTQGTSYIRSMGGAGVAMRTPARICTMMLSVPTMAAFTRVAPTPPTAM